MAGTLYDNLYVVCPRLLCELAQHIEFEELCAVVGIVYRTGTHTVAQRHGHVVTGKYLANLVEMGIEEALLVMQHAPLGHDRASPRNDAGKALFHQFGMGAQHAGVYRKVVYTLLALLDKRIAIYLPGKVLDFAVDLFESLINGHRSHRHGTVAYNPLAGLVYVVAGREVHQGIATPVAAPHRFFHLLGYTRRESRVADIRIELHQEVAAYNHRLGLGVVDVGRDNSPALGHLAAHKLGGNVRRYTELLIHDILAYGHILHLGRNDTLTGVIHLRDLPPLLGFIGLICFFETDAVERRVVAALATVSRRNIGKLLYIAALYNPRLAQAAQPLVDVYLHSGVGKVAARIIHIYRVVGCSHTLAVDDLYRIGKVYFTHTHLYRVQLAGHIYLFRTGIRIFYDIVFYFHLSMLLQVIQKSIEERGKRTARLGMARLCSQSRLVGLATGNDGHAEGLGHAHGVVGYGNGGIYQNGVGSHLHRLGGMRRGSYTGIYHNRHIALFDDNFEQVTGAYSLVGTDGSAQRHYCRRTHLFEAFAQNGVGLYVREYNKAHLRQLLGSFEGLHRVGQKIFGVGVYLQLYKVRPEALACELGSQHCLGGIAHPRCIGKQLDFVVFDMLHHIVMGIVHIDALHSHRDHFGSRCRYGLLHQEIRTEFSCS